jgi:hypothetical protein
MIRSGGVYSSHADLRTLGLSILNSDLLSPLATRQWLKLLSGTGSLVELVGAPWEIARLTIPVSPDSNLTRVSDLYTKAGGVLGYSAILAISPDHGIGYSILTAGESWQSDRFLVRRIVGETFITAAEHAAVANAEQNLAGVFIGSDGPEGANMTLSVDEQGIGLVVTDFYINGTDLRWFLGSQPNPLQSDFRLRLFPTGITSTSASLADLYRPDFTGSVSHRAIMYSGPSSPRADVEGGQGGMFDVSNTWASLDILGPRDQLIFDFVGGRVISVTIPALQFVLTRAFE